LLMKNSKTFSANTTRDILAHVRTYGLTTRKALVHVLFGGNSSEAAAALRELVAEKRLHNHNALYTLDSEPLRHQEMIIRYAVLAYCCLGGKLRPLLPPEAVQKLTRRVAEAAGLSPVRSAAVFKHGTRRIALIRVYPNQRPRSVFERNQVLCRLQEFVNRPTFKPWTYFAKNRELIIVHLMPRGPHIKEMSAWLVRKPLVSHLVDPAIEIPVEVDVAERIFGWKRSR
jgi:hypothetical protein